MKKSFLSVLFLAVFSLSFAQQDDIFNLFPEYSKDYFENGVRAFHNTQYEMAISELVKSLSYQNENHLSRLFLGEAYRKAGYEKNALYAWNTLLSMGYENTGLKNKISYLYNRSGMLSDIFVDKNYIIRTDLRGHYEGENRVNFLNPGQIAVGRNNHYYLTSFSTGAVVELDANLEIVRSIMTANPILQKPFGVVEAKDGDIYVSDFAADKVFKINRFNVITQTIGFKGIGEGALLGPKYLTLDEYDNLYVVDSGNQRINKYNTDGIILNSFGNSGEGKLLEPGGMIYKNGEIFIADRKRKEIVVFDVSGNYLRAFGSDYLDVPYDLTIDKLGRFIIVCEKKIWVYEPDSGLTYVMDAIGERLQRGVSISVDMEDNILVGDFNSSRLFVMSLERRRYNSMYVNVERVISSKFPDVHLMVRVEKDDFSVPVGLTSKNITIYENNRHVPIVGLGYTQTLNETSDVALILDNNKKMVQFKDKVGVLIDRWMKSTEGNTNLLLANSVDMKSSVAKGNINKHRAVVSLPLGSSRLEFLDAVEHLSGVDVIDKGEMFKTVFYQMVERFSKKDVVFITNGEETGNDFEQFKIEDVIQFALNNDMRIHVVAFAEGNLSGVYKNMAHRTGGKYLSAYQQSETKDLLTQIEENKGKLYTLSYVSNSISRFGREPIDVEVEINYGGTKGVGTTIYFPPKN
ncbi:MAG: NHL repeat-containing protein [Spirochaetales bacterium]|nr:NHL repeat-containing protein [Spirochaetales bacterium]